MDYFFVICRVLAFEVFVGSEHQLRHAAERGRALLILLSIAHLVGKMESFLHSIVGFVTRTFFINHKLI